MTHDHANNTSANDLDVRPSERVGDVLDRIRRDASSEAEKGRWFEHLFMATVRDNAEFDVAEIWPWRDWPDREQLTGLDGRDHGIDLVARQMDGALVAVQCKCYAADAVIGKRHIDSFLNESARPAFGLRWIVSTSTWNSAAERAIAGRQPRIARIDFLDFLDHEIRELQRPAERCHPKPLQQKAIDAVYDGLVTQGNDRGKLVVGERRLADGTESVDARYHPLSAQPDAERFGRIVRSHSAIENSLHWVLDVSMDEDRARNRKGNGAACLAVVRRLALNIARMHPDKRSIRRKFCTRSESRSSSST